MMLTAWIFLLSHVTAVALAACCDAHFDFTDGQWICEDGTPATPCCGLGPCNAFCCDCDCRYEASRKRDLSFLMERAERIDSLFQSVDADNSKDVDLGEYIAWVSATLGQYGQPIPASLWQEYIDHFYSFDKDGNAKLDTGEINAAP
ncbi:hypothetical protein B0I35DRAFT_420619 [Stachybotrys elegans]|uniref:EF-hand domain-containing protein n=1 Tax=Stachybotrys elegans TaxID=80388 RepID=A0A8K0WXE9_9HYPO|nr:hypothetical protein B0I35DRAFT_420619 [Stachybotrys elegans]